MILVFPNMEFTQEPQKISLPSKLRPCLNRFILSLPIPNKLRELSNLLQRELLQVDLDLMEIQTSDLKLLVKNKLSQAWMGLHKPVIVEDTSLYFEAWGNLPGPLVKWFVKDLGAEGMYRSLQNFDDFRAKAVCCLGYTSDGLNMHLFEGEVRGQIVTLRGSSGFGWDPIFNPEGTLQLLLNWMKLKRENILQEAVPPQGLRRF